MPDLKGDQMMWARRLYMEYLSNPVVRILLALILAYLSIGVLFFFKQESLIFVPYQGAVDSYLPQWDVEELMLTTSDNVRINARFVASPEAENVILFCHGNAGNLGSREETVRIFLELGYHVLIFDYRGYGKSSSKPGEKGLYKDAVAAWKYLDSRGFESQQIIVWGRSLGGGVASWLAQQFEPKALVLESSFTSAADLGAELYPWLPVRMLCRHRFDTHSRLGSISCPLLVIHSPTDEIVPYAHGKKNFDSFSGQKSFLQIEGGHNDGFIVSLSKYKEGIRSFLGSL